MWSIFGINIFGSEGDRTGLREKFNCDAITTKNSPHFMESFKTELAFRIVPNSGKADSWSFTSSINWMRAGPEEGTCSEIRWLLSSEGSSSS